MIYVDGEKCAGCGVCEDVCPIEAVRVSDGVARIDQDRCNECEACVEACPNEAILMVIEPAEEKAISLHEQPAPEVALTEPHRTPVPLRTKVAPVVGAALAFLGREVAPRLATYLVDALERKLSQQPTLRQVYPEQSRRAQNAAAVSPTNNLAPPSGGKGKQKGRRHRRRRRGK
jgi:Fe-S-cluster-containing hydrogenase component 2